MAPTDHEGAAMVIKEVVKEVVQPASSSVVIDDVITSGDHINGSGAAGHVTSSPSQQDNKPPAAYNSNGSRNYNFLIGGKSLLRRCKDGRLLVAHGLVNSCHWPSRRLG